MITVSTQHSVKISSPIHDVRPGKEAKVNETEMGRVMQLRDRQVWSMHRALSSILRTKKMRSRWK